MTNQKKDRISKMLEELNMDWVINRWKEWERLLRKLILKHLPPQLCVEAIMDKIGELKLSEEDYSAILWILTKHLPTQPPRVCEECGNPCKDWCACAVAEASKPAPKPEPVILEEVIINCQVGKMNRLDTINMYAIDRNIKALADVVNLLIKKD
jgi:hypothetical protein